MSLGRALIGATMIESAENYSRASVPKAPQPVQRKNAITFFDDQFFWQQVFSDPGASWGSSVHFTDRVAFSEWVARIPGLFWRPEAARRRQFSRDAVEERHRDGVTLRPFGKSQVVTGGVGTLRLPPDYRGHRLATFTMSANVSAGVPVLIAPDVWEHHNPAEGAVISVRQPLQWVQMPMEWSSRFPSTRGIPAGCLAVSQPDAIEVTAERAGTQIHPFTIMEYTDGASELFDFVFATGNTASTHYRRDLELFFDSYKDSLGRQGRYLIAGDMATPLWDAEYKSPEDLNRAHPAAQSHLALLERRIRERLLGSDVTARVLRVLCDIPDLDTLRKFSTEVGVPPATWNTGGSLSDLAASFIDKAGPQRLPEILDKLATQYPAALESVR
jgi:hypothetical protein